MISNPTEIHLGEKGVCFTLQFQVIAHLSAEAKVGGTGDSWPRHIQSRAERNECLCITTQLDLFHSYTIQGLAHEMAPPIYRQDHRLG